MIEKKADMNLSKLSNGAFESEFAMKFCDKLSVQIEEFDQGFKNGIYNKDKRTLSDLVHKITSAIMFIEMNDFCHLIDQYKTVDLEDDIARRELLNEVHMYCMAIQESLTEFRQG